MSALRALARRLRWIHLAPVLGFIALGAWAYASPLGAGPDDDYHLVSIWCGGVNDEQCEPGESAETRVVPSAFRDVVCFALRPTESAACQNTTAWATWDGDPWETDRGNFVGEYPPVYYAVANLLVGSDPQVSALAMRLLNAALFVGLATALAALLPSVRRTTLLWGWLITLVPLGMFLIPSNNPSGWAITGVGTAYLALLGWFETTGRRRWALGAIYLVGVIMAAGSRGDAAVYVAGATVVAVLLAAGPVATWWRWRSILPIIGLLIAVIFFSLAGQAGVGSGGFTSVPVGPDGQPIDQDRQDAPAGVLGLAAYNLLMLPFLWAGVWGAWPLGWLDTQMPEIVAWGSIAVFIVVAFAGVGRLNGRKALAVGGVLLVLIALPVYVLTIGGNQVGENLQPRYLLPLIVIFAFVLVTIPGARALRFTRVQLFVILSALAVTNLVALQVNIRRYVTGIDEQGFDLGAGAEWWWEGLPVGPTAVWIIGSLAYAALLGLLWKPLLSRHASTTVREHRVTV